MNERRTSTQGENVLKMDNITKRFPGVLALDRVSLRVRKGSVHALMGENGAGKSTLMKILIGMERPDGGTIEFNGEDMTFHSVEHALNAGISMIHQELCPVPRMTVAENLFLGREPVWRYTFWVNRGKMEQDAERLFDRLEVSIDPRRKMKDLSIANTQMVEIAKALSYESRLVIMDEPTSAITEKEAAHLFKIIRSLVEKGVSFIYISHKMDEIFELADEITVLRDGTYVATRPVTDLSQAKLIEMMVGRELGEMFPKTEAKIGDVVLEVKDLTSAGKFSNVSFTLRKGEILGIAGLMGAGRTEMIESIFGMTDTQSGQIFLEGRPVRIDSPRIAIRNRIGLLTEDRKLSGLFLPLSVKDNTLAASIGNYLRLMFINRRKADKACREKVQALNIKTPNLHQIVKNLSGGNQQKVLFAKWLLTDPQILILDEPTRGVDVGAKAEIHKLISSLAVEGKAIIMISSEMPEILAMSDRILVMRGGTMTGELSRAEATQEKIMEYAMGLEGNTTRETGDAR